MLNLAQIDTGGLPEGWLKDLVISVGALGLIALIVYFLRPAAGGGSSGFVIDVDEEEVRFSGQFPPESEGMVADFLRNDCRIPGSYRVRGEWGREGLRVRVEGAGRGEEQRIRNFLKLNVKRAR